MYKKLSTILLTLLLFIALGLTGCVGDIEAEDEGSSTGDGSNSSGILVKIKVAMIADSDTIDDNSFMQNTWEGIIRYEEENGSIETTYLQTEGDTQADYLNTIEELVNTGYNIVFLSGSKYENVVFEAQDNYPETLFILIDGIPHNMDYTEYRTESNVGSVLFSENEAGFLAGLVAALETKTGQVGYIGSNEISQLEIYGWGFIAGVKYANTTYGTSVEVSKNYLDSLIDLETGQQLASEMYDAGVDIIFTAAGEIGVINEAKSRALSGEEVFVIGVDFDQYDQGIYDGNNSCMLTSAIKMLDIAAYKYIEDAMNGKFKGGQSVSLSLMDSAVGLPLENPNLSSDTLTKLEDVKQVLLDGLVVIPKSEDELSGFLDDES